jgi:hypothetical protein
MIKQPPKNFDMKKYIIALTVIFLLTWMPCIASDDDEGTTQVEAPEPAPEREAPRPSRPAARVSTHTEEPPPPPLDGDADAPIDGGLSLLIAGGIGYGAKKIHAAKKKRSLTADK